MTKILKCLRWTLGWYKYCLKNRLLRKHCQQFSEVKYNSQPTRRVANEAAVSTTDTLARRFKSFQDTSIDRSTGKKRCLRRATKKKATTTTGQKRSTLTRETQPLPSSTFIRHRAEVIIVKVALRFSRR